MVFLQVGVLLASHIVIDNRAFYVLSVDKYSLGRSKKGE